MKKGSVAPGGDDQPLFLRLEDLLQDRHEHASDAEILHPFPHRALELRGQNFFHLALRAVLVHRRDVARFRDGLEVRHATPNLKQPVADRAGFRRDLVTVRRFFEAAQKLPDKRRPRFPSALRLHRVLHEYIISRGPFRLE